MDMNEIQPSGHVKQLRRTRNGRIVAGVCSGVGQYVGVDPNILRIVLAVASFFGGLGIGVYAVAWLLIPSEEKNASIVQDLIEKNKDNPVWLDVKTKTQEGWTKATKSHNGHQAATTPVDPYTTHPYAQTKQPND
ncbi:PspC domain-containing protein [Herbidospora galbida]|uniref:PspC domain-containing protein n=2 Tax=Herbidospora galbida TaxID=2575442 RepID=A0A4U3MLI4_9ACTN|nr:PspC domain-containing protein [Herbidospora galbida]